MSLGEGPCRVPPGLCPACSTAWSSSSRHRRSVRPRRERGARRVAGGRTRLSRIGRLVALPASVGGRAHAPGPAGQPGSLYASEDRVGGSLLAVLRGARGRSLLYRLRAVRLVVEPGDRGRVHPGLGDADRPGTGRGADRRAGRPGSALADGAGPAGGRRRQQRGRAAPGVRRIPARQSRGWSPASPRPREWWLP